MYYNSIYLVNIHCYIMIGKCTIKVSALVKKIVNVLKLLRVKLNYLINVLKTFRAKVIWFGKCAETFGNTVIWLVNLPKYSVLKWCA